MTSPEEFCEVGRGIRLCYRTTGDPSAEPLLLIMGLGQQLNSWPSAFCEALAARGHYVVRFDNRDIGRSSRSPYPPPSNLQLAVRRFPATQYTLADMAEDTDGLVAGLGLDSAHIVGVSMGGMIGQSLAARHPERVRTLTSIISTTGASRVGRPALSTWRRMATPPPKDKERWVERAVEMWRHIGSHGFPFDEVQVRAVARESWERGGGTALQRGRDAPAGGDHEVRRPHLRTAQDHGADARDPRRPRPHGPPQRRARDRAGDPRGAAQDDRAAWATTSRWAPGRS